MDTDTDTIDRDLQAKLQAPLPPRRHRAKSELHADEPKPVAPERIYWGRRQGDRRIVEVTVGDEKPRKLDPRLDLVLHSSDEFEWAAGYEAPLQLALAILSDCVGNGRIALAFYHDFKKEVVSQLPWQSWRLTAVEIHDWIVRKTIAELEETLPPARQRRRMQLA